MKKHGINFYSTYSPLKASVIERFNRTLKNKMWKQFSFQGSYKWLILLDQLIKTYIKTRHRTIKMAPNDVNSSNEKSILHTIYNRPSVWQKNKFKIEDVVRISKYKSIFDKLYTPNFSTELFKITSVNKKFTVTYQIEDMKQNHIAGQFYEMELQKRIKYM